MRKSIVFLATALALALMLSLSTFAQQTSGSLLGTVTDATGAVVPGASITVTGIDVGFNRTVQTDNNGAYELQQIPAGRYRVVIASIKGFASQTDENVTVQLNNRTTRDFMMTTTATATVDVTGEGVIIDNTTAKAQSNLSARQIEALPKGTGFTSLLKTTVAVRNEPLGGQLSINGATGPENSFIVDGQETQNFATGLINTNQDIPFQAIQELQVKTSGFEAEFGGATGGVINAVTKSGSNQFRGEFGSQFNLQRFNAGPRPTYSVSAVGSAVETTPGSGQGLEVRPFNRDNGYNFYPTALISGPIVKDKLWFFAIHSPRYTNVERTTNYYTGFGSQRVPTVFSPLLQSLGASHTQTYRQNTAYDYSQFRLDSSPWSKLRITASYIWNPISQQGSLPGGTTTIGSPATLVINGQTYQGSEAAKFAGGRQNASNLRFEGTYTPTSNLIFLARYTRGFQNEKLGAYGVPTGTPQYVCQLVPNSVTNAGCSQGFVNVSTNSGVTKNVSVRDSYVAQLTYLFHGLGSHELKFGFEHSQIFNDVASGNAGTGRTYLYYAPTDPADPNYKYKCFLPSTVYVQWKITTGTYPCPADSIGTGVTYQFATFGNAVNKANNFFIQDKWQIGGRLTLSLGVRDEKENIPSFAGNSINLVFPFSAKIAPRIGVAYALTGDGKTKIAAFYGRFFDRLKFALPQGSFGGQFYHVSYFYIRAGAPAYTNYTVGSLHGSYAFPSGGQCPNPAGSQYVCDQDYRIPSNAAAQDIFNTGGVDQNVKPYRQSEYTVEFQREVMRASIFTARVLYRNLDQTIEDIGIPAPAGEAYIIGNPGLGLAASLYKQLGYNTIPQAVRKYKALQLEYDTRYINHFSVNLNYTLSRLSGNYSGLASPDEVSTATGVGRTTTPNTNRDFDEPWVGYTVSGQQALGTLPLDRTHVFKASGTYTFDWRGNRSHSTDVSFFTTGESGTPLTTFVNVSGIPIPLTKRGDLGRSPIFTQTDLNLSHKYRFGRDDRFAVALDFNVINLFNENSVIAVDQSRTAGTNTFDIETVNGCASIVCGVNFLTSKGASSQYQAFETAQGPAGLNVAFRQPIAFQETRAIRFGFRFIF
jgi:Carboxypeptidase regulatory-like domain/TonB-dependent Receptor Plug Domain